MKILFYNNFNNGDVHFSRSLIHIIKEKLPNCEYFFLHKNNKGILKDLTFITESNLDDNCDINKTVSIYGESIYINTWYGQKDKIFLKTYNGCTLSTINAIIKNILLELNIDFDFSEETLYPKIFFNNIKKTKIQEEFKILICNGKSMSGQSNNVDLTPMIDLLSNMYPKILFYVTEKINLKKPNIIFTSDITETQPDLLEISYISTKCNIIIGRSSGPYSFSLIYDNIKDKNKTFIGLCNNFIEGIWDDRFIECEYLHVPHEDINTIIQNVNEIIKKYKI